MRRDKCSCTNVLHSDTDIPNVILKLTSYDYFDRRRMLTSESFISQNVPEKERKKDEGFLVHEKAKTNLAFIQNPTPYLSQVSEWATVNYKNYPLLKSEPVLT